MDPAEKKRRFFDSVHQAIGEGPELRDILILIGVFAAAFLFGSGLTYVWTRRNLFRRNLIYLWRFVSRQDDIFQGRIPADCPIVIIFPNTGRTAERCTTVNVSPGGMFLKMLTPYELNSSFHFNMHLGESTVISGIALVRWTNKDGNDLMPRGVGVEFINLSEKDRNIIRKYLKKRKK